MTTQTANNNHKAGKQTNPVIQLINLFKDNPVTEQLVFNYHERLSILPANAINPTANGSNYPIMHTANGFSYRNNTDNKQASTEYANHLLLPLLDSNENVINTALIPAPNENGNIQPTQYHPIRYPKGAFIIGSPFKANDDDNKVFLVLDLESAINLYYLYPNATILVCFTDNNLAFVAKQWQFKAKNRLIVPIACHLLEDYRALLVETTAILYSLAYGIDFPLSNDEVKPLIENAIIERLNAPDSDNPLSEEEKQKLTWTEINEREPFSLLVNEEGEPNAYPLQALPILAQQAVTAIAYYAQAPLAMAGQCVMGALSYLAQPHVNAYDRYSNKGKPCSLFLLTEGASGDRKSSCQRLADQRIYDRQKTRLNGYHNALKEYKDGLARSKTAKQRADFMDNVLEPKNPQSLFKDATLEPIINTFLQGNVYNIAWTSDEAGQIFGGHTLKGDNRESAIGALTTLWDTGKAERNRSRSNLNESGTAYDVRLTINTLGQKAVLQSVLNDPILREQGFLPRFLFSAPVSLAGTRFHTGMETWKARPFKDKRLVQYWQRCDELLDLKILTSDHKNKERPVIPLTDEAEQMLLALYNHTESQLCKSGRYAHFKAFASRIVEQATRISTVLAFFEGIEVITPQLMTSAIKLAQYSLDEWERYNGVTEFDEKLVEADRLENWLLAYCRENTVTCVPRTKVLQGVSPKRLRTAKNLKPVLQILIDQNHARNIKISGKGYIELNPKVISDK